MSDEVKDLQEVYEIPETFAVEIVEAVCARYIDQLLNLALRAARKYDEVTCVRWTKEVMKYAAYVSHAVNADGNIFTDDDKRRLISFYVSEADGDGELEEAARDEITTRLHDLIHLTKSYVAPLQGIEGLVGNVKALEDLEQDPTNKKNWAWG